MKKILLIGLVVIIVGIQFIRPERNDGEANTPQDITHLGPIPDPVMNILKSSCYDCHSNHTEYPWYFNVNPVGLWMGHHIEEGKGELNFSEFMTYNAKRKDHKLEEIGEQVEKGDMPLPVYTFIHQNTKLSDQQRDIIKVWINAERQKLDTVGK